MGHITTPQVKKLRALASKVFPDADLYHEWLYNQFRLASTKRLTVAQAHHAIQMLLPGSGDRQPAQRAPYYPTGSGRGPHLSEKQAKKIGGLAADLGWPIDGLMKFIKRQTGKDTAVEMLSGKDATKVIIGLERAQSYKLKQETDQDEIR